MPIFDPQNQPPTTKLKDPLRVLIVDDQLVVRTAIRTALERLDRPFIVIDAETGHEALSIMRHVQVSMIFCDIHLPGISGPEALAQAYAGKGSKPFMVLMSGRDCEATREIGRSVGVYEFMAKPFLASHVLAAVHAYDHMTRVTRLLLVDDSATTRRLMSRILARSQFLVEIVEAGSGEEAVRCARQSRFDIVLLDLNMPGMNGVEAASQIVAEHPGCQIAIVSTEQQTNMDQISKFSGAFAFLKKPFDEKDVDAVLHKAFDMRYPTLARATHAIFANGEVLQDKSGQDKSGRSGRAGLSSSEGAKAGWDQAPPTAAM
jgi:CheY-like chemotaxis protein